MAAPSMHAGSVSVRITIHDAIREQLVIATMRAAVAREKYSIVLGKA